MENKELLYQALKENKGRLNEVDLGESLGFDEETTNRIISILLAEYKIAYIENNACNYSIMNTVKKKLRKWN